MCIITKKLTPTDNFNHATATSRATTRATATAFRNENENLALFLSKKLMINVIFLILTLNA